jgi:hypothetical protein
MFLERDYSGCGVILFFCSKAWDLEPIRVCVITYGKKGLTAK